MTRWWISYFFGVVAACGIGCVAQELEPRAYTPAPAGANFVVVGFSRSSGDTSFDPALPIEDANAVLHASFFTCGRTLNFFGRSANVAGTMPYVWGEVQGKVYGVPQLAYRSGLANPAMRLSVNLYGAPAMNLKEFVKYRQKTNIGVSIAVTPPLGQYDPARFVNIGTNRWGVKPEIGLSRRIDRWLFDTYLGAWLYTANNDFQGRVRRQDPIVSTQFHVSYNITRAMWVAFNANFYAGGRTTVNDTINADLQRNSRVGATILIPLTKRQAVKISASRGAITNIGANFISVGMAYQYFWGGGL